MNWLALNAITGMSAQTMAQISVERILNALPEGLLIALFAWALLRVFPRQNSGTRFAVWFLALLTVAVLPLLSGIGGEGKILAPGMAWGHLHPAITIPGSWALFAFMAWALGMCVTLTRVAGGLWHLRQLRRSCTAIPAPDLDPLVRKTLETLGAAGSAESRAVTLATSEEVRVPAAIGFRKRTIVLPAWALRELSPADLNVILLHEFAHLRRGDDWTNLIQKIVRAIFFFHPAVWWIESRLSVEREMACDDAVLAETSNPHGYASCLVSLLEKNMEHRRAQQHLAQKRWSMAQAVVDRAREASLRLARILDANRPVATRVWKPALGVVGVFSMLCLVALPHAPQFVAFDRGTFDRSMRANSHQTYTEAINQAAPHLLASASGATGVSPLRQGGDTRVSTTRPSSMGAHQSAQARAVAARWNVAENVSGNLNGNVNPPLLARVVQTGAIANDQLVPQFQTLVFIEARQYMTSGSPVWNVQVWRVIFVGVVPQPLASASVSNSI
jgi:Zn-dependent protease with chaperone function